MKDKFQNFLRIVIGLYAIIAFFIFAPYFNWQYANENGFVKWLFLGQIIPTARAVIWPYYVFFAQSSAENSSRLVEYSDNDYDFAFQYPSDWKMKKLPEKGEFGETRVMVQGPHGAYAMVMVGKTVIISKDKFDS